ncbi:MAG: hypothetical protein V4622_09310 [Bacteroidota bacterium]
MKIYILLIIISINYIAFTQPEVLWKQKLEGSVGEPYAQYMHPSECIATDNNGNVVVTGRYSSQFDIDGTDSNYFVSQNGQWGSYIASYTNNGAVRWGYSFDSQGVNEVQGLAIDSNSNIYIYGMMDDTVDLDPSIGIHNLYPLDDDRDLYIVKLDSNGQFIQAMQLVVEYLNPTAGFILNMEFDSNSNMYISGYFRGLMDADPGPDTNYLTNYTGLVGDKGFILKYDSSFELINEWTIASPNQSDWFYILDFNLTSDNGFYITGEMLGTFDVAIDTAESFQNSSSKRLGYIAKYSSEGTLGWFKKVEMENYSRCHQVVVDAQDNATILGNFGGDGNFEKINGDSIIFDWSGSYWDCDYFILKYDNLGFPIWGKHLNLLSTTATTSLFFNSAQYLPSTDGLWTTFSFHSDINLDLGVTNQIMSTSSWPGIQMSLLNYDNSSGELLNAFPFEFNTNNALYNFFDFHNDEMTMWGDLPVNINLDVDLSTDIDSIRTTIGGMYMVRYCMKDVLISYPDDTISKCIGDTLVIAPTGALNYEWVEGSINGNFLGYTDSLIYVVNDNNTLFFTGFNGLCRSETKSIEIVLLTSDHIKCVQDTLNLMKIEKTKMDKKLINITDILGRETKEKQNTILLYIYSDGSIEKKIILD